VTPGQEGGGAMTAQERKAVSAEALATARYELTVQHGVLAAWPQVREFVFAGNATFTLVSLKTGVRFTYKVTVKKADVLRLHDHEKRYVTHDGFLKSDPARNFGPEDVTYFVNLLRGPDNTGDFTYMGVLRRPAQFNLTSASKVGRSAPSFRALVWMLDAMQCGRDVLGKQLEVWHEGRCGRCGRKLTVPSSILRGLGDRCNETGQP
jgi:Family of unknown function (DUF6011)